MNSLRNLFSEFNQRNEQKGLSSVVVSITATNSKIGSDIAVRRSYSNRENSETISIVFKYFFWRRLNESEKIELILQTVLKKIMLVDDKKINENVKIYLRDYINSRLLL